MSPIERERAHSIPSLGTMPARRSSEAGSAYLAALIVLVLLTIIGLSLSLITQTEMQIGSNERLIERAFYAADSGISLATAETLVTRRPAWSQIHTLPDLKNTLLQHKLDVSPFYPIGSAPCNLCDVNNAGQYGETNYYRVNHAVTSTAMREVTGTTVSLAEKSITAMVEFQPWELPPEAVLAIQDDAQLAKIKF